MKKLLSLVLVLLMVAGAVVSFADSETEYVALGLNIKNKTGVTIDAAYIYPVGGEKGNSVVAPGWQDKDADKANYEKNIYIVRPAGAELEILVTFADGTEAKKTLGQVPMYTKISLKNGADPEGWEIEPVDDAADEAAIDLVVATGKTADNCYPGYELIPVELKNKTGLGIAELRFYEEGGDPANYTNMMDYLYRADGTKVDVLMSGKAKEGGMYIFKCFIRPHSDIYNMYVKFDNGSEITYPIEDWFKPNGDGFCPNEISLKSAEDEFDIKVQYDDGDPEPLQYLALSLENGYIVDQWYPVYEGAPAGDPAAVEAVKAELAKIPVPAAEEPAEEPAPRG